MTKRPAENDEGTEKEVTLATKICKDLEEKSENMVQFLVKTIGCEKAEALLSETVQIEKGDGMKTADGERRRTPGGVYLQLAKEFLGVGAYNELVNKDKKRRKLEKKKQSQTPKTDAPEDSGSTKTNTEAEETKAVGAKPEKSEGQAEGAKAADAGDAEA